MSKYDGTFEALVHEMDEATQEIAATEVGNAAEWTQDDRATLEALRRSALLLAGTAEDLLLEITGKVDS